MVYCYGCGNTFSGKGNNIPKKVLEIWFLIPPILSMLSYLVHRLNPTGELCQKCYKRFYNNVCCGWAGKNKWSDKRKKIPLDQFDRNWVVRRGEFPINYNLRILNNVSQKLNGYQVYATRRSVGNFQKRPLIRLDPGINSRKKVDSDVSNEFKLNINHLPSLGIELRNLFTEMAEKIYAPVVQAERSPERRKMNIAKIYNDSASKILNSKEYINVKDFIIGFRAPKSNHSLNSILDNILYSCNPKKYKFPQLHISQINSISGVPQRLQKVYNQSGSCQSVSAKNTFNRKIGKGGVMKNFISVAAKEFPQESYGYLNDNFKYDEKDTDKLKGKTRKYDCQDGGMKRMNTVDKANPMNDHVIPKGTNSNVTSRASSISDFMKNCNYFVDNPFIINMLQFKKRTTWLKPENVSSSNVSTHDSVMTPLEKLKSSSAIDAAKMWSGSTFAYREELKKRLESLVEAAKKPDCDPLVKMMVDTLNNSEGVQHMFGGDFEYIAHFKNILLAIEEWETMSISERVAKKVQHFDAEFFKSMFMIVDLFHCVKSMITSCIGAKKNDSGHPIGAKGVFWFFRRIYFLHYKTEMPTNDLVYLFCHKFELIKGVEAVICGDYKFVENLFNSVQFVDDKHFFGYSNLAHKAFRIDHDQVLQYRGARVQMWKTILLDIVPILGQIIDIFNSEPTEDDFMLLLFLLIRTTYILKNYHYFHACIDTFNKFGNMREKQPDLFKSRMINFSRIQSVILEFLHALLKSFTQHTKFMSSSFDELNKTIARWTQIQDANELISSRYGATVNPSYTTKVKGEKYIPHVKQALTELFDKIKVQQEKYEAKTLPNGSVPFCPFIIDDVLYLPGDLRNPMFPTEQEIACGCHLTDLPKQYLLPEANDMMTDEWLESNLAKFYKYSKKFDSLQFLQSLSEFSKKQKDLNLPFPDFGDDSWTNKIYKAKEQTTVTNYATPIREKGYKCTPKDLSSQLLESPECKECIDDGSPLSGKNKLFMKVVNKYLNDFSTFCGSKEAVITRIRGILKRKKNVTKKRKRTSSEPNEKISKKLKFVK